MLIVSSLHCSVHVIFERCFYVDCVVITLLRSCHIWTLFLCWLCRHCIVKCMSYFGRRFYVDCVVITLLRSCHIWTLFLCWLCRYFVLLSCHSFKLFLCVDCFVITLLRSFSQWNVVFVPIMVSLHWYCHLTFVRCFYFSCIVIKLLRPCNSWTSFLCVDCVVIALLRFCHILDVVSMLIVSSLHSYVPFIFGRRFYVDCVVIPLLRSCQMWTLFLCWLCRHSIVTFLSYLQVVSMCRLCRHYIVTIIWHVYVVSDLVVSSLKCYILVKCGRCFCIDCVVITLLRSCHIWTLFICRICRHYIVYLDQFYFTRWS